MNGTKYVRNEKLHSGDEIRTCTGRYLNVFKPNIEDIHIEDIANGLSQQPRFTGQLKHFFSVAQHSIRGSMRKSLNPEEQFTFLLHDATEAYLCDIPRPIKRRLPEYKEIEEKLMKLISVKFDIRYPFTPMIKQIDEFILEEEFKYLMVGPNTLGIVPLLPSQAKSAFLYRFQQLKLKRELYRKSLQV